MLIAAWITIAASWGWIGYLRGWFGECGPLAPKEVPFHEGMTLCPGQSTTMTIVVPVRAQPKPDTGI